ncbi:growth/differentiation factor 8-like [Gigantopelta aegis]|uniref:growth/differentiation factor 8-like n=1 Tax=Gigantopelta aegis TaxID=1735272 RepID=UPI001B88A041|nr:growth/differentiation factor 8-like [Gigantopelta aegis]
MDTVTVRWMVFSTLLANFLCHSKFVHDSHHGWRQEHIENLRKRVFRSYGNGTTVGHGYWRNNTKAQSMTLASLIRHQDSVSENPSLTRSFVIGEIIAKNRRSKFGKTTHNINVAFNFDKSIPSVTRFNLITKLQLCLWTKSFHTLVNEYPSLLKSATIDIYSTAETDIVDRYTRTLLLKQQLNSLDEKWTHFDIPKSIIPVAHKTLILEIKWTEIFGLLSSDIIAGLQPVLILTSAGKPQRRRRELPKQDCSDEDKESRCCRYHMYISFKELFWDDWVIAPPGYDAYYCAGSCPHRYKMAHTFAGIQSLLHMIKPSRLPGPTCSPTTLSPLTLLHLDERGYLRYTSFPDMIVDGCHCT